VSEASRNWPDMGQVIQDNLQAREDERPEDGPEEGADSDEDRVARARRRHEELGKQDKGGVNSEPLAEAVGTPGADVKKVPARDERAAAEDKSDGGEYGKSISDDVAPPAEKD
jgi:hypothetical protein